MGLTHWLAFHPAAWDDIDNAVEYYVELDPNLPGRFLAEVGAATDFARQFPAAGRIVFGDVRRRPLKRFPYVVLYWVRENMVWVAAVVDQRRDPKAVERLLSTRN